MRSLAPQNALKIVNYGEYLAAHPPLYEVKIKPGDNDEGTSWSCVHGLKRWKEDCGCGGGGGWVQGWRKPLRETMDWLRDQMIIIFENIRGQKLIQGSIEYKPFYLVQPLNLVSAIRIFVSFPVPGAIHIELTVGRESGSNCHCK